MSDREQNAWPVISIIGQTATGKTDAALSLANTLLAEAKIKNILISGVDLISADSRQVYKGLEIISGADIPAGWDLDKHQNLPFQFFQQNNGLLRLHGVAIIQADLEWSVGQFGRLVKSVVKLAEKENRVVILVGGTGLYHQSALKNDWQLQVPPDSITREKATAMTVLELQKWVESSAPEDYQKLNESDKSNPRRLVRVLEKHLFTSKNNLRNDRGSSLQINSQPQQMYFGLKSKETDISFKIRKRVESRIIQGVFKEIEKLISISASDQALTTLGVSQIGQLMRGEITKEECIDQWTQAEISYSKRQQTWWQGKDFVKWIDQNDANWLNQLQTIVLQELFRYNQ